jgi:uncharacterized membrane protein YphA (DoxX/SURF4 family)
MSGRLLNFKWIYFLGILFLGILFFWAGFQKAIDLDAFSLSIYRYHLLPSVCVNMMAIWFVGLELVCAFLLFIPSFRVPVLWILFFVLFLFSIVIAVALIRGFQMSCGCFSSSPLADSLSLFSVVKNMVLMLLIVLLLVLKKRAKKGWGN